MRIIINWLINSDRIFKQGLMVFADASLILLTFILSFSLRLDYLYWPQGDMVLLFYFSNLIAIPIFYIAGLYRSVIRYIGFKAMWVVIKATSLYILLWTLFSIMLEMKGLPRSVILINWILTIFTIGGLRLSAQWLLNYSQSKRGLNVLIYGAGSAGRQLCIALKHSEEYTPIAFIDDDYQTQGSSINGLQVIAIKNLDKIIKNKNIKEILLATPSISRLRRKEIIKFLSSFPVIVRSLPNITELVQGKVQIEDLRQINIKDLLGRSSVASTKEVLSLNISNKVVMVTGAGGSIGSELCKQILFLKPKILILYDLNEFALYLIDKKLASLNENNTKIIYFLGSVTNKKRLQKIFQTYRVQTIYHTAAYKHVPIVELNVTEGVDNNVFGTLACAQAAISERVETFILISTDKAVRPTSIMGSTKRLSEMLLQGLSKTQQHTRFTMVRFGNVLDSSGSVIPLFKKQIKAGGPVTVTDPEVVRYFMTIPEAVELLIQAGSMAKNGGVYVLDMGEPVKILDLAVNLIKLSGLHVKDINNPNGDIEIHFTGLRPGEKLYEELLIGDNVSKTDHSMILVANEEFIEWKNLKVILLKLEQASNNYDYSEIRKLLIEAIPEYEPDVEISDILNKN